MNKFGLLIPDISGIKWVLRVKGIPAEIDLWGHDVNHDWPWWRKMLPYHLGRLNLPGWQG